LTVANVLSLAMKISADASGFKLDPVQRALVALGTEADKLTGQFEKFAGGSDAAGRAQQQFGSQLQDLQNALRDGAIGATEFAIQFERLTEAANKEAAAFQRAAQITEANITPLQRYERTAAELKEQLDAGRISQETYSRAMDKAKVSLNGVGDSATKADKTLASLNSNVSLLTKIEIGRVLIDGLQALSGVFQRVTGQITSLVTSVNSSLDTLNDFSARTGIGVEALQGYSLAAKLAGVDTEQFGVAVQRLGVNIGKANPGDGFDKNLKAIGLSVAELRALAPEQQFSAIGDAISQLPTAADRAAAAVEIFGKQGAALAPLFREGASSIDELRQRAERLGIIVSETQVNNVGDLNDAFDTVSATINGIIGQVVGNLAPAVTAVVDEFLKFVEEWSGAQGSGGTGIANAITDSLLEAADYFAGVFDFFTRNLEGVSSSLDDVAEIFRIGGQLLLTGAEGFRTIFNVIQIGIDALLIGLGKVLEGIGSWVSDDLEQFGAGLAAASQESADRNAREMEAAATNAANAFSGIFDDVGNNAEQAGQGAASRLVGGIKTRIQQERAPEFRIESNVETLRERFDNLFDGLVDQSSTVTKLMQEFEQALAAAQQDGELTADEIERIETLQLRVNSAIDEEARGRKEAADAAQAQAAAVQSIVDRELEQIRIQNQFGGDEARAKNAADLTRVRDEIAKTEAELARANANSDTEAAARAAARLAQLDQVEAKLSEAEANFADRADETAQGFADGFDKAFQATTRGLDDLIGKASDFGNEGAKAAQQLQDGVARAQQQVRDGILSQAAYEAEVANQRKLADERLAQLERERQAQQQAQQEAFQRQVDANTRVNEYLKTLVTDRARLEAEAFEQTNKRKIEAAQNLKAIEDQIATQQRSVAAAREAGDLKAAKARQAELGALEKLKRAEQNIVDGKVQANQQINAGALASANAQAAQQQQFANAAQKQVGQLQRAANDAIGLTNDAFAKAAERQQKLFNDLNTLGSRTVETADARTAEGAAIVLGLATTAQDPRLIEQRLGNKIMREIAEGLATNLNRIGIPATLL
jgi:hypothetical protein